MPAFELRFITAIEDIPGCLISVDARTVRGDVSVVAGAVKEIKNRAPASLRKLADGDKRRSKYWSATYETSGLTASVDPNAFLLAGGIAVPAGGDFIMTSLDTFPPVVAGEYTVVFVVDRINTGASTVFLDGAGLIVKLDNGAGNAAFSDAGAGGTGPAAILGPQLHVVRFGKATPLASPTADWRRNCAPLFSAAYTPTNFSGVGTNTRIFGGAVDFTNTAGKFVFFNRRLTDTEVAYVESELRGNFFLAPSVPPFRNTTTVDWLDPARPAGTLSVDDPGAPTRLNAEHGHNDRTLRVARRWCAAVDVLVVAVENAGAGNDQVVSTNTSYVASYWEYPFQGREPEPYVAQDVALPGVCRLRLALDGHYLFMLKRTGGGGQGHHFDVGNL